MHIIP